MGRNSPEEGLQAEVGEGVGGGVLQPGRLNRLAGTAVDDDRDPNHLGAHLAQRLDGGEH